MKVVKYVIGGATCMIFEAATLLSSNCYQFMIFGPGRLSISPGKVLVKSCFFFVLIVYEPCNLQANYSKLTVAD